MGVIKIGSKTCGPCMAASNKLKEMNIQYTDLDAHDDAVINQYNIKNIPTIIKTDSSGNEEFRLTGGDCLRRDKLKLLED